MDSLDKIIREGMRDCEQDLPEPDRYSAITQHLMLAEMIHNHHHLTPRESNITTHDNKSFHSISTEQSDVNREDSPTIPPIDLYLPTPTVTPLPTPLPTPLQTPSTSRPVSHQANVGRIRAGGSRAFVSEAGWTNERDCRPLIPKRTSSMNTGRRLGNPPSRHDLVSLHHRSRQVFSSLDSTLSNAMSSTTGSTHSSSPSTSPSLASSVTTQATSILDDEWHLGPSHPSLRLELRDPRIAIIDDVHRSMDYGEFLGSVDQPSGLSTQRSTSKLNPDIISTAQVFWTSEASRDEEYAKIDAAHSGIKGFFKRILPKRWVRAHEKRRNFYTPPSPKAADRNSCMDDDSVRRYRISIASATKEAILNVELHGVSNTKEKRKSMPQVLNEVIASNYFRQQADANIKFPYDAKKTSKYNKSIRAASAENLSKFLASHTKRTVLH